MQINNIIMEEAKIKYRAKNMFNSEIEHVKEYSNWEMTKEI